MALYSERFETAEGDKLDFSVITKPSGHDLVNLTIFKTTAGHDRRRRAFGFTLSLTEWLRLKEWLPKIGD